MSKKFSKLRFLYRAYKYKYVEDIAELKYIKNQIQVGDLVLDIGTHKGGYLHWIRKAVGSKGRVIAFEPQPILYEYVTQALDSFGYHNVELHHAGVSSENGQMELFVPKAEGLTSPGATFEKRPNKKGHFIKVPVLQLDQLLAKRQKPVSLIKLDVEGHELEVFKGASRIFEEDRPKLIFECENRHLNGLIVQDVFQYLEGIGYEGSFFKNGLRRPLQEFNAETDQNVDDNHKIIDKKAYCNNFVFEFSS